MMDARGYPDKNKTESDEEKEEEKVCVLIRKLWLTWRSLIGCSMCPCLRPIYELAGLVM
jgi:hypothetical protein